MTEREIKLEERCVAKVEAIGGAALKLAPAGTRGFPDRTVFLPEGIIFLVEFKRRGKAASGLARQQHAWHVFFNQLGFKVHIIDTDEDFAYVLLKASDY